MNNPFSNERPIYLQIVDRIKVKIITKEYSAGDKLPSVREIASLMQVNPNTMQKALSELERSGLLHSRRTSGRFITEDETMLQELRDRLADRHIHDFMEKMKQLGFREDETLKKIQDAIKEEQ